MGHVGVTPEPTADHWAAVLSAMDAEIAADADAARELRERARPPRKATVTDPDAPALWESPDQADHNRDRPRARLRWGT